MQIDLEKLYGDRDYALRDTHPKTHACVKGTLDIFDFDQQAIRQLLKQLISLPPEQINAISFKQGLFPAPLQYPIMHPGNAIS